MPTKDHKRKGIEDTLLRVLFRGLPKDDEIHRILGILTQPPTRSSKLDSE